MDSVTKRMVCFAIVSVFLCLWFVGCAADMAQRPSQPVSPKTKAQLKQEKEAEAAARAKAKREKKARDAEIIRQKREAAEKAKREAAELAKARRQEKARLAKLDAEAKKQAKVQIAQAKREKKARDAEIIRQKREAAEKAKREAAELAKAKRQEKTRLAKLDAGARKEAKAEIAQAKRDRKVELAKLDATAKKQAKKQAKEIKAERESLNRKFKQDKANLATEYKLAKGKITKKEKARMDAEYKKTLGRLEVEYKSSLSALKQKADEQAKQVTRAKSQKKAELAQFNAKSKKQAQELSKEIKAEKKTLKRKFNQDKARMAADYKQANAKAAKNEKANLKADYKQNLSWLKAEHKNALATLEEKADAQAEQTAKAKAEKKAELAQLDAKAKEQAKEIKTEKANLKRKLAQDKDEVKAKKYGVTKLQAEYKEKLDQLKAEHKKDLANLKEKAAAQRTDYARKKEQIEMEYQEKVAKIKMKQRHQREKAEIAKLSLPEDTTPRFTAKELRIGGNALISTAELLEGMPLVYNASDKPLEKAESDFLYDLSILADVILQPGRPREVSARTIQGFTQYILSVYQDRNYAGIYVYIPAGAIREGTKLQDEILPVEILEAPVTEVTVAHYDPDQNKVEKGYLRASAIEEWSPIKPGQVANQKELDDFVNLLNLNPDRYVSAVVTRGREPKSLAVGYDIYEADPWHYFIQADNSGTDDRKWNPRVGLVNTNLTGIDDRFTAMFQGPLESNIDDNYSYYGNYEFPLLGPRLRLGLYGGRSTYDIGSEGGGIDFRGKGEFYGSTLRFNAFQTDGWFFDITGSLSHEKSKLTPSLFSSALKYDLDVDLLGYGVDIHRSDDMSNTSVVVSRVESINADSRSEFARARPPAGKISPDFRIYTASAAHNQFLDPDKIGRLSGTFRFIDSSGRLIPAKMTTFGGMYTVRGYKEDKVVADGGILASAQYEFDLVKYDESKQKRETEPEQAQGKKELELKKLAPLVFFDYGRAKIKHPVVTEKETTELCSVGVGTIVEIGDNFSGGVYYGYPLRGAGNTDTGEGRLNVSLLLRW